MQYYPIQIWCRICVVGSCNGMSKLTEDDVREIRMNYIPRGSGVKCNRKELANQYGVSANLISKIVSGQIWTHV